MDTAQAKLITGGLSKTTKMPGPSFSISAARCHVGSKMRDVENSACKGCYALKGHYVYPVVKEAHERRFQGLSHPQWIEAMVLLVNASGTGWFRWHDSGDIQSLEHLENIVAVCKLTPRVKHWIPTREYSFVSQYVEKHGEFPRNLTVRLSALIIDGPLPLALANRLGVTVSGVTRAKEKATCPAYTQGGACVDCRACWVSKKAILYPKH